MTDFDYKQIKDRDEVDQYFTVDTPFKKNCYTDFEFSSLFQQSKQQFSNFNKFQKYLIENKSYQCNETKYNIFKFQLNKSAQKIQAFFLKKFKKRKLNDYNQNETNDIDLSITKIENNLSYDNSFIDQSLIETFQPTESKDQVVLKNKINELVNLPSLGHDELIKLNFMNGSSINNQTLNFNQKDFYNSNICQNNNHNQSLNNNSKNEQSIGFNMNSFNNVSNFVNKSNINIRCIQNNTLETARFDGKKINDSTKKQNLDNLNKIICIQKFIRMLIIKKLFKKKLRAINMIQKNQRNQIFFKKSKKIIKQAINNRLQQFKYELEFQLNSQQNLFKNKIIDYKFQKNLQTNFDSILIQTHNKISKVFNTGRNIINLKILTQKQSSNKNNLNFIKSNIPNDLVDSNCLNSYHSNSSVQSKLSSEINKNPSLKNEFKKFSILNNLNNIVSNNQNVDNDQFRNQNQHESNDLKNQLSPNSNLKNKYKQKSHDNDSLNKNNDSNMKQEPSSEFDQRYKYLSNEYISKGLTVRSSNEKNNDELFYQTKSPIKLELEEKIKSFNSQIKQKGNNLDCRIKSYKDSIKEEIDEIKKKDINDFKSNIVDSDGKKKNSKSKQNISILNEIANERNQISNINLRDKSNINKKSDCSKIKNKYAYQKNGEFNEKKKDLKSDKNKQKDESKDNSVAIKIKNTYKLSNSKSNSFINSVQDNHKESIQKESDSDKGNKSNRKLKKIFSKDKEISMINIQTSRNSRKNSIESSSEKKIVDKQLQKDKENLGKFNCSLAKIQNELRELNYQFKTDNQKNLEKNQKDFDCNNFNQEQDNQEYKPKLSPMTKNKLSNRDNHFQSKI